MKQAKGNETVIFVARIPSSIPCSRDKGNSIKDREEQSRRYIYCIQSRLRSLSFPYINGTDRNNFYWLLNFISAPFPSAEWADKFAETFQLRGVLVVLSTIQSTDNFYKSMRKSTSQCRAKFLSFQNFPEVKLYGEINQLLPIPCFFS